MRARFVLWAFLLSLLTTRFVAAAGANPLDSVAWMSEQLPPYNFVDADNRPSGIVLQVVGELVEAQGGRWQPDTVAFLPWARAYAQLERQPQTALFAMVQTLQRESLFRFVGPVIGTRVVLLAPKGKALQTDSVDALNKLRIGVVRQDIGQQLLQQLGVADTAIQPASQLENLILQMRLSRIDAIAYEERVANWQIRELGFDPADYAVIRLLHEGQLSIAFHRETPAELLHGLQGRLDQLRASGRIAEIAEHYTPGR